MTSLNEIRYGQKASLPRQVPLRAGALRLVFEAGELRSIKWGSYELARRIYVAVRDRNWGTVAPLLSDVHIDLQPASFHIVYQVTHRDGEIFFSWRGEITGRSSGEIDFSMAGQAQTAFYRNRIGFCVLHPASLAGAPCLVEHRPSQGETLPGWDGLVSFNFTNNCRGEIRYCVARSPTTTGLAATCRGSSIRAISVPAAASRMYR